MDTVKPSEANAPSATQAPPSSRLEWLEISVQGRPCVYGVAGNGPTVLFLHGWGLDHRAYKRALRRLVDSGVRVLAPALPGFGGTDRLSTTPYTIETIATWVAEFLDVLGTNVPVLVMGHSFGGGVAIVLAHEHPEKVSGLVLVNSIGASTWSGSGSKIKSMAQRPLWDWGLHFPGDLWPIGQARRVLPVITQEAIPNLLRDPLSFWRIAGVARRADLTAELQDLNDRGLPVVVLWGNRDKIVTREAFEEMCRVLGDPKAVTVQGTHAWLIADPDAFGEVMTNVVDVAALARSLAAPARHERRRRPAHDATSDTA